VVEDGEVWVLDRKVFQSIMLRTGLQRIEDNLSFLKSVPLLTNISHSLLSKIADSLQPVSKLILLIISLAITSLITTPINHII
jgi:cGMP-dependent protein kinase